MKYQFHKINILIFLCFVSLLLFSSRSFSNAQENAIVLNNIHKVISIIIALFLSIVFILNLKKLLKPPKAFLLYGGYIFIGLLSTFFFSKWIGFSLWKLLEITAIFSIVYFVWIVSGDNKYFLNFTFKLILKYYKFLVLLTLLGVILFPNIAIIPSSQYQEAYLPYILQGAIVKMNSNSLGVMGAILFFISFVRLLDKNVKANKKHNLFWLILSGIILIFAQSRTSLVALLLVLILYLIINRKLSFFFKLFIFSFSFVSIFLNFNNILLYLGRGYNIQHLEKLSGRLEWWSIAWDTFINGSLMEHLIGMGFGVANREILSSIDFEDASTLHSDYVDSLISTGFIGSLFLISSLIFTFVRIVKNYNLIKSTRYYSEVVGVFVIIVIRSFSGTSIAFHNFFLIMFLITMINILSIKKANIIKKVKYIN